MHAATRLKKLAVLFCMTTLLAACSGTDEPKNGESKKGVEASESQHPKDVLHYVNYRDIRDLNPHLYGGEMFAMNILYESLVKVTDKGIEPWLAESWDISPDGLVYTFHLRKGVTFTDGYTFDSAAVMKNFDAIMENKDRHTWLDFVRLIDSYDAPDESTFRITLKEPYFPVLIDLGVTRPFRFISPNCMKDGSTKDGVSCFVGTNSYVLKENHVDRYSVFERNENYWGEKPAIKTIIAKVIPDNQSRVLALQNHEVDIIYGTNLVDAATMSKFKTEGEFSVAMSEPLGTRMILFNTRDDGALKERAVRRAVQHAVNKQAISQGIFEGVEAPADFTMAKNLPYCDIDLQPYVYDLKKAQALLEEAGWTLPEGAKMRQKGGVQLTTTLYYDSNSVPEKGIAEYLQSELAKIGMQLNIHGEEEQAYRDRQKAGKFGMIFNISWGTPYDPQAFMAAMKLPVYGDYIAQQGLTQKPQIDEHIAKALVSRDETERQTHFTYVLKTLHEEAVYLPLTYENNRSVFRSDLKGVTFNPNRHEVPLEKMYW